jgi:predicted nuclease of restriction endonuclease-like (RecB) superfamily
MNDIGKSENNISIYSDRLFTGIAQLISKAQKRVAISLNAETTLLYWSIGNTINTDLKASGQITYGSKIIATLSQQLTVSFGKGYTYTALTRMCKVAETFNENSIATVSQLLSWSHLIELAIIEDTIKRTFYIQLCAQGTWSIRQLRDKMDGMLFERTVIAAKPEETIQESLQQLAEKNVWTPELVFKNTYVLDFLNLPGNYSEKDLENALIDNIEQFILELGQGFAFIERQKRIPIDSEDYHLDLLFYHRKLKRMVAIDLKLGKFKPKHKAQMELYLRWLQKNEMQAGEETPIGLLLCSEGNTEHIELLMLDNNQIRVAQYLTELPSKAWFADKLHRALEIAKQNTFNPKSPD